MAGSGPAAGIDDAVQVGVDQRVQDGQQRTTDESVGGQQIKKVDRTFGGRLNGVPPGRIAHGSTHGTLDEADEVPAYAEQQRGNSARQQQLEWPGEGQQTEQVANRQYGQQQWRHQNEAEDGEQIGRGGRRGALGFE